MKAGPRDVIEAGFLWLGFALFRTIGIESASALGGCLGRFAGRLATSRNRIARRNIEESFPGIAGDEVQRIITGMWDNFGRLVAEFPHLHTIDVYGGTRVTITRDPGVEEFANLPAIFVGAHFGCFDLGTLLAIQEDIDLTIIYRQANNPLAERLIQSWRLKCGGTWAPKGRKGSQLVLKGIRRKGAIAVLADQKYSQGVAVSFFGREAKTAPALAELALKHDIPLIPIRVLRKPRAHFHVHLFRPLEIVRTGDGAKDVHTMLRAINATYEDWIREYPEQWLWLHRRWDT